MLRKVFTFCDFPEVHEEQIDKELENNMEHVLDLVVMGRACRNASTSRTVSQSERCL